MLPAYKVSIRLEGSQRKKRSIFPQSTEALNSQSPNANNAVSLEQNTNSPNIIYSQEKIQNLFTLANNLFIFNYTLTSAANTAFT